MRAAAEASRPRSWCSCWRHHLLPPPPPPPRRGPHLQRRRTTLSWPGRFGPVPSRSTLRAPPAGGGGRGAGRPRTRAPRRHGGDSYGRGAAASRGRSPGERRSSDREGDATGSDAAARVSAAAEAEAMSADACPPGTLIPRSRKNRRALAAPRRARVEEGGIGGEGSG